MLEFFINPLVLLSILAPILLFIGILAGHSLSQPRKNRVLQIAPESGRGTEFEVKESNATILRCDPVGNTPPQRFIKRHNAFNIVRKGWLKLQNYALWVVRFGTAYVTGIESTPGKATMDEAFRSILKKEHYDQLPAYAIETIKSGKLGVTIGFSDEPLTPIDPKTKKPLPSLSSDDLRRGDVDQFVGALARGVQKLSKTGSGDYTRIIFQVGSGIAIGIVLSLIFKWGAPVVTPSAQVIMLL